MWSQQLQPRALVLGHLWCIFRPSLHQKKKTKSHKRWGHCTQQKGAIVILLYYVKYFVIYSLCHRYLKNQDTHVFYVVCQKSPCFLQLCCALTTGHFVASNGSNWPFGSWESAASLNLKIGWVLWDLWHFENWVFLTKIQKSWNLHISNLTFLAISNFTSLPQPNH